MWQDVEELTPDCRVYSIPCPIADYRSKKDSFGRNNGRPAEPHREACAERQCWVHESIGVVNIVPRDWEGDRHFANSLQNCPDARAHDQKRKQEVSRAAVAEHQTRADEQPSANLATKRHYLESCKHRMRGVRIEHTWICREVNVRCSLSSSR